MLIFNNLISPSHIEKYQLSTKFILMEPNHSILILNWKQGLPVTLSGPTPIVQNILIFFFLKLPLIIISIRFNYIIQILIPNYFFTLVTPSNSKKNKKIHANIDLYISTEIVFGIFVP